MPYKDPEMRAAVKRESARKKRAGDPRPSRRPLPGLAELKLESAKSAIKILAEEIANLQTLEGDAQVQMARAKTIAYLISVGLRAIETGEVESRLEAIEDLVKGVNRAYLSL